MYMGRTMGSCCTRTLELVCLLWNIQDQPMSLTSLCRVTDRWAEGGFQPILENVRIRLTDRAMITYGGPGS